MRVTEPTQMCLMNKTLFGGVGFHSSTQPTDLFGIPQSENFLRWMLRLGVLGRLLTERLRQHLLTQPTDLNIWQIINPVKRKPSSAFARGFLFTGFSW
jgi:hypothetical protein